MEDVKDIVNQAPVSAGLSPGLAKAQAVIAEHGNPALRIPHTPHHRRVNEAVAILRRQAIQEAWLNGRRISEIAFDLGLSIPTVSADITAFRKQLYEDNQATLSEHTEQSVTILRRSLFGLHNLLKDPYLSVRERVLVYEQIRKTEETVAKMRGILVNKSVSDLIVEVKMYDFADKFPSIQEAQPAVEGNFKELPDSLQSGSNVPGLENINVPNPSPSYTGHVPEFNSSPIVILPNGDVVDTSK